MPSTYRVRRSDVAGTQGYPTVVSSSTQGYPTVVSSSPPARVCIVAEVVLLDLGDQLLRAHLCTHSLQHACYVAKWHCVSQRGALEQRTMPQRRTLCCAATLARHGADPPNRADASLRRTPKFRVHECTHKHARARTHKLARTGGARESACALVCVPLRETLIVISVPMSIFRTLTLRTLAERLPTTREGSLHHAILPDRRW